MFPDFARGRGNQSPPVIVLSCIGRYGRQGNQVNIRFVRVASIAGLTGAVLLAAACGAADDTASSEDSAPPLRSGGATVSAPDAAGESKAGAPNQSAAYATTSSSGGAAAPADTDTTGPALADQLSRKIIFNATVALDVKDVAVAFNRASAIARESGGYVERSSFEGSSGDRKGSATVTLRVPVDRYQDTLGALRTMDGATVRQEGTKSNEVTEQYTDLQSRLRNLQSTEVQYLELLKQAKTIQEILTVNDRVNGVRSQIEQIQGRLKVLDAATELATVDVTLAPVVAARADSDGPRSFRTAFADAWESSLDVARNVANAGAVVAVASIWLAVPLALVVLGTRRAARRGRHTTPAA